MPTPPKLQVGGGGFFFLEPSWIEGVKPSRRGGLGGGPEFFGPFMQPPGLKRISARRSDWRRFTF